MLSDEFLAELPDDPAQAFILLEKEFRNELILQNRSVNLVDRRLKNYYITSIMTSLNTLELKGSLRYINPDSNIEYHIQNFDDFLSSVGALLLHLKIKRRGNKKYSVQIDIETRSEIINYVSKIKTLIRDSKIEENKKDAIFKKIHNLEIEIERVRTRYEVVADFMLATASLGGEIGEKLEPLRKWVDSIARLIGNAKKEEQKQLTSPDEIKQIEPPKEC
ncbi:hypothetical protein [Rhodobium gokarnense]|uniref:Uncharacterized protein n=1 Tax=Rhodobium gokarnense TaxID=364296 RepID=A0ABT3HDT1_9HYPH|nr:hypothetical protein [Rhodobium gokarnense]MCW2308558.1 hypothetical protein [Rhodobium gokarnense]